MIVVQDLAEKVMIRNSRRPPYQYNWQWCLRGAIQGHYGPVVLVAALLIGVNFKLQKFFSLRVNPLLEGFLLQETNKTSQNILAFVKFLYNFISLRFPWIHRASLYGRP